MPETTSKQTESSDPKADDLLSQLASEEVDRLLSEAEVERKPIVGQEAHVEDEEAEALKAMLEESAGKELTDIAAGNTAPAPPAQAKVEKPEEQEDLSSQLDQLFAALTSPESEKSDAAQSTQPAADGVLASPPDGAVATGEIDLTAGIGGEEKAALEINEAVTDEELIDTPRPWWLKPLEILNAPFASISESTKEKLGWIAIETLIFAAIILVYVIWFKGQK